MCKNYLKIEHSEIRNMNMLRLPKLAPKKLFARRDLHRSIIHVYTPFVNISRVDLICDADNLQSLEAISATNHKNGLNWTKNTFYSGR